MRCGFYFRRSFDAPVSYTHLDVYKRQVLLSIGVRPATALAQQAGLKLGEMGGIWVDEHLETSEKDIYAVGDAIEYPHPLTGKPWLNYLANPANRQGRILSLIHI